MATAPMLSKPEPGDDRFVIQSDASYTGLGGVLTEVINDEEKVLEFVSVCERELLAVLWATRKFRPYIKGYRFKVITDYSSLR